MTAYRGYEILPVKEKTIKRGRTVPITTYQAKVGEKVIAVGLPSVEACQEAVDKRIAIRSRMNLEPVG